MQVRHVPRYMISSVSLGSLAVLLHGSLTRLDDSAAAAAAAAAAIVTAAAALEAGARHSARLFLSIRQGLIIRGVAPGRAVLGTRSVVRAAVNCGLHHGVFVRHFRVEFDFADLVEHE
jgi:hypothetical protein